MSLKTPFNMHKFKSSFILLLTSCDQVCTRSSAKHPYPSVYPTQIGQPNADEVSTNNALLRSHTATSTYLVWEGTEEVATGVPEQSVVVKVPIVVDTNPRTAALNHKPQPYALQPSLRTVRLTPHSPTCKLFSLTPGLLLINLGKDRALHDGGTFVPVPDDGEGVAGEGRCPSSDPVRASIW